MTETPRLAVVIPTFRRVEQLGQLMGTLAAQTLADDQFEVVVVDDCSGIDLDQLTAALGPQPFSLRVLRTARNGGPAGARNLGWRSTTAPLVAFTDDDCCPQPGWLAAGLAAFENDPALGVVQGRTALPPDQNPAEVHWGPPGWIVVNIIEGPTPHFEGCNLFFRRQALVEGGGFDESVGFHGEDAAAGWGALEAGWGRGFASDAVVLHPLVRRGWLWFVRFGWREHRIVHVAARYPGYRKAAFWKPWAFRREDLAFAVALVGVIASIWFLPSLVLIVPYVWWRRPPLRQLAFFRLCIQIPVVDAARLSGHLFASVRDRVFVL